MAAGRGVRSVGLLRCPRPFSSTGCRAGVPPMTLDIRTLSDQMLDAAENQARTRLDDADAIAESQESVITDHYRRSRRDIPRSVRHEDLEWELWNATPTMIRNEAQM